MSVNIVKSILKQCKITISDPLSVMRHEKKQYLHVHILLNKMLTVKSIYCYIIQSVIFNERDVLQKL